MLFVQASLDRVVMSMHVLFIKFNDFEASVVCSPDAHRLGQE